MSKGYFVVWFTLNNYSYIRYNEINFKYYNYNYNSIERKIYIL